MNHRSTQRGASSEPSRRAFLVTAAGAVVAGGSLLRGAMAQETPRSAQPGSQGERPDVRPEAPAHRDLPAAASQPAIATTASTAGVASQASAPYAGTWAEGTVPDTLDLPQRAELALHALTGALDPEYGYELFFQVRFCQNPAMMFHEGSGLPTNNPKFAEAQAMMRIMSGSDYGLDIQHAMLQSMLRNIHEDGLYYSPMERRPWSHEGLVAVGGGPELPFANVYGNARFLLAMMALSQADKDPAWEGRIKRIADGLVRIAIDKGDYAYYPVGRGVGEAFSYTPGGWTEAEESTDGHFGVPMYFSGPIRALAAWYELSGDRSALTMAGKLTAYLRRPALWHATTELDGVFGPQHGHCTWHFHAHTAALRGLLAYAMAIQDTDLIQFVRDSYEWLGQFGVARIGWFPEHLKADPNCESCCTADMVALAIRLSDAGAGDYWDDVDRYVRNQLVEQQLTRRDYLERLVQSSPPKPVQPPRETADRVIERNIGAFVGHGALSLLPDTWIMHCCTGNATTALYYAWESITRFRGETAVVNLLLNRASTWLDVQSCLPHEGRVTLVNKAARRVAVRVPSWVDRKAVQCWVGTQRVSPVWAGNYVLFEDLRPGTELDLRFAVQDRVERFVLNEREYTAHFRGHTVVELTPRQAGVGYPIYERSACRAEKTPLRRARRFIPAQVLNWT